MTYKNIFLSILLVPLTAMSNSPTDAHIHQLQKKILQKELELSSLGAMIAEKDKLLSSFGPEIRDLLRTLIDKRTEQLEEEQGKILSEEEKRKLFVELRDASIGFVCTFCADYGNQQSIEGVLTNGLICQQGENMEFESLRFFLLRCAFERPILRHLIAEFETCLQELRTIENEVNALKA